MIGNITDINRRRSADIVPERIDRLDKTDENNDSILTTDEIDLLVSNIGENTDMQLDREEFLSQLERNGNLEEKDVGLRDPLRPPERPPRHRTLDAIKTYGEVAAAESEEENQPPTIVVPV